MLVCPTCSHGQAPKATSPDRAVSLVSVTGSRSLRSQTRCSLKDDPDTAGLAAPRGPYQRISSITMSHRTMARSGWSKSHEPTPHSGRWTQTRNCLYVKAKQKVKVVSANAIAGIPRGASIEAGDGDATSCPIRRVYAHVSIAAAETSHESWSSIMALSDKV